MPKSWEYIIKDAIEFRHLLHRTPEIAWSEVKTAGMIREKLSEADISFRPCAKTGTVAVLGENATGPAVALRADIDALALQEENNTPWTSQIKGRMHACGHDGHTATLMAVALWLKQQENHLPAPVICLFQPGEEGGHGAREMIEEGALDGVSAIYGWHNWPAIPFGKAICPDGVVMAANGSFRITVHGKGGHASQPELCRDPIVAGSAIVLALQQIVSRRIPPQQAAVVGVTSFHAPSGETTIPTQAVLSGNIRISDDGLRDHINHLIKQMAEDTARAWGTRAEVEIFPRYGATMNHPEQAKNFRETLFREFGAGWQDRKIAVPVMASEDFHYYLNHIPGAIALIGSGGEKPLHHPQYDFNDSLIAPVARVLIQLANGFSPKKKEILSRQ